MTHPDPVRLTLREVYELSYATLTDNGLDPDQAAAVAAVITAGERDGCLSHGLYRLAGCVRTIRSAKFVPDARPKLADGAGSIVRVNAGHGFSCLAFEVGRNPLASAARAEGIGALVINDCFHFSALWPEVEALAEDGLVAIAMTPSHSWVAPAGGTKPVFGTNPIAFAWPRSGRRPYVFDFATSETARGEIELRRQRGEAIPPGWALDNEGQPTTDPTAALSGAMLAFGGHKGSAMATMVELMAGALVGDMMSFESQAFDAGAGVAPCHGELILALSPDKFLGADAERHLERAEALFSMITDQGARLPSQRRYAARRRSEREGIEVSRRQYEIVLSLRAP